MCFLHILVYSNNIISALFFTTVKYEVLIVLYLRESLLFHAILYIFSEDLKYVIVYLPLKVLHDRCRIALLRVIFFLLYTASCKFYLFSTISKVPCTFCYNVYSLI